EAAMMREAVARPGALRRFMADALQGLPDATLVVDDAGCVSLANRAAQTLIEPLCGSPEGRLLDEILAALAAGEVSGQFEAGGRTYELRRERLVSAGGAPLGEIVRLADI